MEVKFNDYRLDKLPIYSENTSNPSVLILTQFLRFNFYKENALLELNKHSKPLLSNQLSPTSNSWIYLNKVERTIVYMNLIMTTLQR